MNIAFCMVVNLLNSGSHPPDMGVQLCAFSAISPLYPGATSCIPVYTPAFKQLIWNKYVAQEDYKGETELVISILSFYVTIRV